ncbi:hypothetical protein AT246_04555 [Bartonella henselae]|uniref:Uncharacterized protein n=1 Tax=Bartonella henselae (strain ATCC 49882 / DSM 28221 / CCUG 30454 / Houston 1) TaxID=283166 RepID=A0A0H3M4E0_BARHE|nr:hypothetical protein AT237_02670 [Bartonella henselae]CAF28263.1 hypothetical protein BH15000 [Bartonella henselae str. Houston-1]OLL40168.1 hypothetical protein AT244_06810 [Bartonella henselae]OLL43559.1 hypothetical protein AT245_02160 [Bartonella henselae]OLL52672.1 hypothetical protein AT239_03960 [Bartonella henselae]
MLLLSMDVSSSSQRRSFTFFFSHFKQNQRVIPVKKDHKCTSGFIISICCLCSLNKAEEGRVVLYEYLDVFASCSLIKSPQKGGLLSYEILLCRKRKYF